MGDKVVNCILVLCYPKIYEMIQLDWITDHSGEVVLKGVFIAKLIQWALSGTDQIFVLKVRFKIAQK